MRVVTHADDLHELNEFVKEFTASKQCHNGNLVQYSRTLDQRSLS